MDNTVTVSGNLTRDPELRFTQGGQAVCSIGLAVNRRYQQNNEWVEKVSFLNAVAWGQMGENLSASLNKGARVLVTGRVEQRSYEDAQGEKRSVVEIVIEDIGASLKWATAQVERTTRSDADRASGQPAAPKQQAPADPTYSDEEPF